MLLHVPKTGHVLLHASKVKRVPIPCGLQTAGNYVATILESIALFNDYYFQRAGLEIVAHLFKTNEMVAQLVKANEMVAHLVKANVMFAHLTN
jgi:hypothetical protein